MEVIIVGILGPVIEVAKCIGGPIKRHLNYLCSFNNNIESLKDEAQKLEDKNIQVQRRVTDAKNNAEVIDPEVETWLKSASQNKDIISRIENEVPNVSKGCLNLISRYSLSKKAKKTAEALRELHNCKFDRISQDAPPASMGYLPIGPEGFETRRRIEEGVMEALTDRNVNMIGLYGMGGVGKTTMAERIMNRVQKEKLFDEAVKVVVSQQVKMHQLQQSIAEQLHLTLDGEDLLARAHKIRTRLTAGTNRILLVVDDIWDSTLKLQDLGIPRGNTSKECKILLTSRDMSALNRMDVQRIFEIKILLEGEAWILFREKTGNCVDREDLHSVAEDVAKECKGLPVALVTVGGALKNKERPELWHDALLQLRRSNPVHLPNVLADVYNALKLSYDCLEDKDARSLFLLCSMFEEDVDIDLEILTWYGMGLNMFERLKSLTEARNRTCTLIEFLKDRSLLLGSDEEYYVKMHDVVRDMAIYTALETKCGGSVIDFDQPSRENCYEDCFWISVTNLSNRTKFPAEFKCPSLRLLTMHGQWEPSYWEELPGNFFDGMQEIRALFMKGICTTSLLPIQMLKNLKILSLHYCPCLESIRVVGELLKLEILSCNDCDDIEELPVEIGRLNHLRLLEIFGCVNLKRIARGVISNLINLEELRIKHSFNGWEAKESTNTNAALVELEPLTELTLLEIEIKDVSLVAEEIRLPSKIKLYDIKIGDIEGLFGVFFERRMSLGIPGPMNVGNWVKTLLSSTEALSLKGDGANQDNFFYGMQERRVLSMKEINSPPLIQMLKNLKELRLHACPTLKSISFVGELLKLEILSCESCERIEELPIEIGGLKHLKELGIRKCQNLKRVVHGVISNLISLEELRITYSFNGWEAKESTNTNAALAELEPLTKLTLLEIEIKDVSLVAEEIRLPSKIKEYDIKIGDIDDTFASPWSKRKMSLGIPRLMNVGNWIKTLLPSTKVLHLKGDGANQVNLIELAKLEHLSFESCSSVKALVNAASVLPSLEYLKLKSLDNLEEITPTGMNSHNVRMAFPNLKCLELVDLPKLLIVQETLDKIVDPDNLSGLWLERLKDDAISSVWFLFSSFSNLENVEIGGFNSIKNIMSFSIARNLVRLRYLTVDSCQMMLEVIADDEEEEKVQAMGQIPLFPHLECLKLRSLPELRSFCQWNHHNTTLELPSLSWVAIDNCPQMETFTQGSVSTSKLTDISINDRVFDLTKGVNEAIQLYRKSTPIMAQEGEQDEITSSSANP